MYPLLVIIMVIIRSAWAAARPPARTQSCTCQRASGWSRPPVGLMARTCFRAEYPYLEDLLRLERGRKVPPCKVPTELTPYPSTLWWRDWGECLAGHPDRRFAEYIVNGVRVGYSYETHSCKKTSSNMRSALDHSEVVRDYIARECAEGRLLGPFDPASLPGVQTSRFGVMAPDSGPLFTGGRECQRRDKSRLMLTVVR